MSKKEIKLHLGFLNEQGKIEPVPEHIQKAIDNIDRHWFEKMKEVDKKCGILLDKLTLTEKALELMAKSVWSDGISCMKFLDTGIQVNSQVEYLEYFKTKAKEMMKSE